MSTSVAGSDVLVVGTGLIGTSIGLAATAAGRRVWLDDQDADRVRLAASLGAGEPAGSSVSGGGGAGPGGIGLVVVAVPPQAIGAACVAALATHPQATVTHVGSVQSEPAAEVEASGADVARFVGGHPIAGRELSGPAAADPALFVDRAWAVCAVPRSARAAVDDVVALARDCRARPVFLDPDQHDRVLARLSHAPQLVASALAATLADLDPETVGLAGTGLRDTTRVADSDPAMWGQIAASNAAALAAALRAVADPLLALADTLDQRPATGGAAAADLVSRGRRGRALLPGKHGRRAASYATVHCAVPDEPGALARLFADIAAEGVNVEDLRVEHAPGQPVGVIEMAVAPGDRSRLLDGLRERGWTATQGADEAL